MLQSSSMSATRRAFPLARFPLAALALLASVLATSDMARAAATTHYVAATGSVGANSSCSSPGYVGATEVSIQAAINAASSGDTIHVCAGTYAISPRLTIAKSLTFRGASVDTSVLDGGGSSQILYLEDQASDITVDISNLTFRNGGANTRNGGECNLGSNCGGAIYVDLGSVVNIDSAHFYSNRAMFGGAVAVISASRSSTIKNSSFVSNSTLVDGGAILALGGGGLSMDRITVVDNYIADGPESRDGSAIVVNFSSATMTNSTLVNNHVIPSRLQATSGQIYVNGTLSVKNSILASTGAGNIRMCRGTTPANITSGNLITDNTCGVTGAYPPGSSGASSVVSFADLKLGELGYGGYASQTVPLLSGSAALNYWTGGSCTGTDQRGVSVPQGASCDVGAYERHASQSMNTPTTWSYGSTPLQRTGVTTFPVTTASTDPAGQGVTYSSSTTSVCTVNSSTGALTAVSTGTCVLKATAPSHLLRDADSTSLTLSIVDAPATTTTVAPATTTTVVAPSSSASTAVPQVTTTVAASQSTSEPSATTPVVAPSGSADTGSPSTTALNGGSAATTSTTVAPATTTTVPAPDAPDAAPGEAGATVNGDEIAVDIERADNALVMSAGDVTATVYGVDTAGDRVALDADGNLRLEEGDSVVVEASGYEPGSDVEIWLRSTPVQLGVRTADSSGSVYGRFAVPSSVQPGDHRVIVAGVTESGDDSVIGVGLRIGAYEKESGLNKWVIILPLVLATMLALVIPTTARRRRRANG